MKPVGIANDVELQEQAHRLGGKQRPHTPNEDKRRRVHQCKHRGSTKHLLLVGSLKRKQYCLCGI